MTQIWVVKALNKTLKQLDEILKRKTYYIKINERKNIVDVDICPTNSNFCWLIGQEKIKEILDKLGGKPHYNLYFWSYGLNFVFIKPKGGEKLA
jgi:hypothetical protein